jgi:ABC-2 type transport system ATP-binding protein
VILTTHDLADVERLTRRIVLIDEGRVIFEGPLERLREEYGTHRTLVVTLSESYDEIAVEGAEVESREGSTVRLRFNRRTITAEGLIRRVMERYRISDISIIEPEIESIVRRIYREGYRERAVEVTP